jgi:glycosyltransferase involved in cell wall biosynthesis
MKIFHYFDRVRLEEGGTTRAAIEMCSVLATRGHEVTMLTYDDTDAPESGNKGAAGALCIQLIPKPALPGQFFSPQVVRQIGKRLAAADVLHLHGMWVPSNPQVAIEALKQHIPYVLTLHGMLDDWSMAQRTIRKRVYLAACGKQMLRRAAALHTVAEGELNQASKWMPAERAVVVPCIIDLEPFRILPGPELAQHKFDLDPSGPPRVLFLSRLHYKKCPEILIQAFALLRERGVDAELLIAGTGEPTYVRQLKHLAEEQNVAEQTKFLGMVTGEAKLSLYQHAAVFALPTSQENFGLVFAESLACRTPVVGTKGTDIWRELEASGGAVIADRTPEAFAEALAELLAAPDRAQQMGERGRKWVFKALDPHVVGSQFEAMYVQAIQQASALLDRRMGVHADGA